MLTPCFSCGVIVTSSEATAEALNKQEHKTMSNLTFAENYILDCIEENLEGETITEISDKVDYLKTRFYGEYGFMINRQGETTFSAAREWLLGLALNTHYTYDDIVTEYFDMDVDIMSEGEVYDYNDLYWNDLAEAVTSLVKNY